MNISFVLGIPAWTKRRFLRQLEIQEDNFASIFASIFSMSMTLSQEHILIPHLLVCCLFSAKIGGTFFYPALQEHFLMIYGDESRPEKVFIILIV